MRGVCVAKSLCWWQQCGSLQCDWGSWWQAGGSVAGGSCADDGTSRHATSGSDRAALAGSLHEGPLAGSLRFCSALHLGVDQIVRAE